MSRLFACLAFVLFGVSAALAQPLQPDKAFSLAAERNAEGQLRLTWTIEDDYYLYEDRFELASGGHPVAFDSSDAEFKQDPYFGKTAVFHHRAVLTLAPDVSEPITAIYQGCQEGGICYMPLSKTIDPASLLVTDGPSLADAFAATSPDAAIAAPVPAAAVGASTGNLVTDLLGDGGAPWVIGGFVLFGLLLSFTPCVFPMYPIVAGALARDGERLTARRGFGLSATYVVFLGLAFALVGAIAGWTGQNLQMALQSPITIGVIAALFVIIALSMFGLFELGLPSAWTTRIARATGASKGNSYPSMAVLGFSSALIIGPCVTAPLAGALVYIAQSQDWVLGATALFALGLGKGIPLILLSTFGVGILPRAGAWMVSAKTIFGFAFLATAILVATPLLPLGLDLALWSILALFASVYLLGLSKTAGREGMRLAGQSLALVTGVYGLILAVGAASGGTDPVRPLASFTVASGPAATANAKFTTVSAAALQPTLVASGDAGRPSMVYFTADWCISCRHIEASVLRSPDVNAALADLDLIKVDLTHVGPAETELMKRLDVIGPPSMLFFGEEARAEARLIGEIDADHLIRTARSFQSPIISTRE